MNRSSGGSTDYSHDPILSQRARVSIGTLPPPTDSREEPRSDHGPARCGGGGRVTRGFYANDEELETTAQTVNADYRENYDRLVRIKNKYDPGNLFRLNANVQPTV